MKHYSFGLVFGEGLGCGWEILANLFDSWGEFK